MSADADFSEMRNLAFDLGRAQATVYPKVRAIVQKTMYDAKRDMQAEAEAGGASGGRLAPTISYETKEQADGIVAEVGPVKGGAGSLALLYFGNYKSGPVIKDPLFAMQRNVDKALPHLARVMGDIL